MIRDPQNRLASLDWRTREAFKRLAEAFTAATGYGLSVRSTRRSCAEQNEQVRLGFSTSPGCRSFHVIGRAVDADPFYPSTGKLIPDCRVNLRAGEIWERMGGTWGGRWTIFGPCGDAGHFQWDEGKSSKDYCPNPNDCSAVEALIETERPMRWGYVALGAAVVVIAGAALVAATGSA